MQILKLAPEPVLKPWGLVHEGVMAASSIRVGVGELWLASAQTGPGNRSNSVVEPPLGGSLAAAVEQARAEGEDALLRMLGPGPVALLKESPYRGKTEAWHVRQVSGRTGLAAGPRTEEQKEGIGDLLRRGGLDARIEAWPAEVRELFGLIEPLEGGEVFLAPAGTMHTMFAVGPESRLVIDEIQQGYGDCPMPTLSKILLVQDSLLSVQVHPDDRTVAAQAAGELELEQDLAANPTVRITDFGRRPGEHPELGLRLTEVGAGLRRVRPARVALECGGTLEFMVACPQFAKSRFTLPEGARAALEPTYGSYRVLHCTGGAVRLAADGAEAHLAAGETAFVPAALESSLRLEAEGECSVFDDALPDLGAVRAMLTERGASALQVEALLDPPSALASGGAT